MTKDVVLAAIYEEAKLTLETAIENALIGLQDKTIEYVETPSDDSRTVKLVFAIEQIYASVCHMCEDGQEPTRMREINGVWRWKHVTPGGHLTCGASDFREIVGNIVSE